MNSAHDEGRLKINASKVKVVQSFDESKVNLRLDSADLEKVDSCICLDREVNNWRLYVGDARWRKFCSITDVLKISSLENHIRLLTLSCH